MLSSVVTSLRALHQWIMSFAFINQLMARLIFFPSIARMTLIEGPQHRWYDRVDDTTIIGALPFRSQTDKLVKNEDVRAVLSFNEPYELRWFTNSKKEWEENGVTQHIFTTVDFVPPTMDDIKEGLKIINKARSSNHTVYIHCKAGRGRSAVMTTCYLMSRYKWTPDEALDFLKQKRPQVKLSKKHRATIDSFHQQLQHNTRYQH